jgi:hypothetical protein
MSLRWEVLAGPNDVQPTSSRATPLNGRRPSRVPFALAGLVAEQVASR